MDFTGGDGVGNAHQLCGEVDYAKVVNFFRAALTPGLVYDGRRYAFQLGRAALQSVDA